FSVDAAMLADMTRLPGQHKHIAMVPQWDLLDLLAEAAEREPTFTLRMSTEATGLIRRGIRVTGVRYRTADGRSGELHASLVVACDGRSSMLRKQSGLRTRSWRVPMDAWWFRVPREEGDPRGLTGSIGRGRMVAMIDRGDYFQVAFMIKKGTDREWRARGLQALRDSVRELAPWLADRVDAVSSLDDVKLLSVELNRLPKWYRGGLLCLGDAAHAMSPIGGVGINLAVQDAVAAARLLAAPLREGRVTQRALAKVQLRRWLPTVVTQGLQRIIHAKGIEPALRGTFDSSGNGRAPLALRLLSRFPALQVIPAYLVSIGILPERAPRFARRAASH
ncbi:MAG: FAD-dependent oxidoreductase, partial [Kutzneria sp.]|nr:FAD-dependent oxidoreductase [Kutzneria sp.]